MRKTNASNESEAVHAHLAKYLGVFASYKLLGGASCAGAILGALRIVIYLFSAAP